MWKQIPGFSDYYLNEQGQVFRLSTKKLLPTNKPVAMKNDEGLWKNRTVNKLLVDLFNNYDQGIVAVSARTNKVEKEFRNIKEAAIWLHETKQAITAGKLAAHNTIRYNIKRGLTQPELYPFMYGYVWKYKTKMEETNYD